MDAVLELGTSVLSKDGPDADPVISLGADGVLGAVNIVGTPFSRLFARGQIVKQIE